MSGGYFDYKQYQIVDIQQSIRELIDTNTKQDEYGYCPNYTPETIAEFLVAEEALALAAIYVQRIDWLRSGDDSEETFHERLNEELRKLYE